MNSQTYTCNGAGSERVRYFSRQLITADDMLAEQQYFRQKLRRHNRYLHGWGVVCGLKVIAVPTEELPWRVKIDAGYALVPYGDEIYLAEPFCLDLAKCLESVPDPCEPGEPPKPVPPKTGKLYVAIRYVECETRPVRIHPLGCACEDTLCEYSRIRDDFEISCLPEPPPNDPPPLLCDLLAEKQLPPCPPCPESPWVVLAEVTLPKEMEQAITDADIDNFVRRQLFRTAILQEQLIDCCCEEREVVADLEITQHIARAAITVFNLTVTNHGLDAAKNVTVKDIPPAEGSIVANEFKTSKGSWTFQSRPEFTAVIGDMNPGEIVQLSFAIRSARGQNTAMVSSSTPDPNPANNKTTEAV
jgi:hypothetical protein